MAERCVTVLRVIATGINAWRRMRGSDVGGRAPLQRAKGAHEGYDRCPEIKGLPTERNKVSQSRWRPFCSNVIGCGSAGVRCSSHTDPMPDFFSRSHPPFPVFGGKELLDTGNWRKRVTPERVGGGGNGGGWIFVIMKRR